MLLNATYVCMVVQLESQTWLRCSLSHVGHVEVAGHESSPSYSSQLACRPYLFWCMLYITSFPLAQVFSSCCREGLGSNPASHTMVHSLPAYFCLFRVSPYILYLAIPASDK
jgi:hypothetical protein